MTNIANISSLKELRSISFADLFYELYENPEGKGVSRGIIAAIDPGFVPSLSRQREEALFLLVVKETVAKEREEYLRKLQEKEQEEARKQAERERQEQLYNAIGFGGSYLLENMRRLEAFQELQDSLRGNKLADSISDADRRIKSLGFDELLGILKDEVVNESPDFILALASDDSLCSEFLAVLDEKITQVGCGGNKALKGLFMLPELSDDQDLIIFFGNNFHATFANIDAYTGLLYASEFFDYDGFYLQSTVLSASKEDKDAIVQSERNAKDYSRALQLLNDGDYDEAISVFEMLGSYRNSRSMIDEAHYREAKALLAEARYAEAISAFQKLGRYKDSEAMVSEAYYQLAVSYQASGDSYKAEHTFSSLAGYKDSALKVEEIKRKREADAKNPKYAKAKQMMSESRYGEAEKLFLSLGDWLDSSDMAAEACEARKERDYRRALDSKQKGFFDEAIRLFKSLGDYEDSEDLLAETRLGWEKKVAERKERIYQDALKKWKNGGATAAIAAFNQLGDYKDSRDLVEQIKQEMEEARIQREREAEEARIKKEREEEQRMAETYERGKKLFDAGDFEEAEQIFIWLGNYRDSQALLSVARSEAKKDASYRNAVKLLTNGNYIAAEASFRALGDYKDSQLQADQARYAHIEQQEKKYNDALALLEDRRYKDAESRFRKLGGFRDSSELASLAYTLSVARSWLVADNFEQAKRLLNLPELANSRAAERMLEDVEKIELAQRANDGHRRRRQEEESQLEIIRNQLSGLMKPFGPVASEVALEASIARCEELNDRISSLGFFAFRERSDLEAQLHDENERQSEYRKQIPLEKDRLRTAAEKQWEQLSARELDLCARIESLCESIEEADAQIQDIRSRYK